MPELKAPLIVPLVHSDSAEHRRMLAVRANNALMLNDQRPMDLPLKLVSYTVAGVPAAADWEGGLIYVSNEVNGATVAFSDGTNWRRVQDRAIISS